MKELNYKVVIPARYDSTRYPGKPLVDLLGKSMLLRTYEQCLKAVEEKYVFVATDSKLIQDHCEEHEMNCVMTSSDCLTGTDRIAEFAEKIDADWYINVQGDEPVFNPNDLSNLINYIEADNPKMGVYNGYAPILHKQFFNSVSVPKVVIDQRSRLLYMSRAGIPLGKDQKFEFGYRQICLYGFRKDALKSFSDQKSKTPLEAKEDIEILRFLEMGYGIQMLEMSNDSHPIDNHADVEIVEDIILDRKL